MSTSNGGRKVWTMQQRTTLFQICTTYDASPDQIFDLMGRIHGNDWQQMNHGFSKPQVVRDEFRTRWREKKSKDWDVIDTPTPSADQQARNDTAVADIANAIAMSGGMNYLTGRINQPLALQPLATPYISTGRPATAAGPSGTRVSSRSRPKKAQTQQESEDESDLDGEPDVDEDEDINGSGMNDEATLEDNEPVPSQRPFGSKQPRALANMLQTEEPNRRASTNLFGKASTPSSSMPKSQGRNQKAPQPRSVVPPLHMVHDAVLEQEGTIFRQAHRRYGYVNQDSRLYKYGGEVTTVKIGFENDAKSIDIMVCSEHCRFCLDFEPEDFETKTQDEIIAATEEAEADEDIPPPEESLFGGKPFVHAAESYQKVNARQAVYVFDDEASCHSAGGYKGPREVKECEGRQVCEACKQSDADVKAIEAGNL